MNNEIILSLTTFVPLCPSWLTAIIPRAKKDRTEIWDPFLSVLQHTGKDEILWSWKCYSCSIRERTTHWSSSDTPVNQSKKTRKGTTPHFEHFDGNSAGMKEGRCMSGRDGVTTIYQNWLRPLLTRLVPCLDELCMRIRQRRWWRQGKADAPPALLVFTSSSTRPFCEVFWCP